jgi:hypothetical protein
VEKKDGVTEMSGLNGGGGVALLVRDGITCWVPEFKIPGRL